MGTVGLLTAAVALVVFIAAVTFVGISYLKLGWDRFRSWTMV